MNFDEGPRKIWVRDLIEREGYLIALLTLEAYALSYSFQKSYLANFGIDENFVSLDFVKLTVTGFAALSLTFILLFFILCIPYILLPRVFYTIIAFRLELFFGFIWFRYWGDAGVTTANVFLFILVVITLLLNLKSLSSAVISGSNFRDWTRRQAEFAVNVQKSTIDGKISSLWGDTRWAIILGAILAPVLLGPIFASYYTSLKTEFLILTRDDREYALVSEYGGGFVFSMIEYSQSAPHGPVVAGEVLLIETSDLSGVSLKRVEFARGILIEEPQKRATFSEWWRAFIGRFATP